MKKSEIAKAKDNDLITEYVSSYASLSTNYNLKLGTKRLEQQCIALETELLKRGILTIENIERLNK